MLDTQPPEFFSRGRPHVRPVIGLGGANVSLHRSYNGSLDMWLPKEEYIPMLENLTQHFRLPETYLLLWHWDGPPSPLETNGGACCTYKCQQLRPPRAVRLNLQHQATCSLSRCPASAPLTTSLLAGATSCRSRCACGRCRQRMGRLLQHTGRAAGHHAARQAPATAV